MMTSWLPGRLVRRRLISAVTALGIVLFGPAMAMQAGATGPADSLGIVICSVHGDDAVANADGTNRPDPAKTSEQHCDLCLTIAAALPPMPAVTAVLVAFAVDSGKLRVEPRGLPARAVWHDQRQARAPPLSA